VPLLALFGGAALWLVLGIVFEIISSLTFHNPEMFANCPLMTYGHTTDIANDLLVYGFAIPAALGVMLWIFARLSETELALPFVPIVAANIWHFGIVVGVIDILIGNSTGFAWLEFPRGSSVLLLAAFFLIAISAVATFGQRKNRELNPAHWFLLAALFWFPWIYATANFFLIFAPVRGVSQAVIDWWFANNLLFVWFALVGLGVAFHFLPKFAGRALPNYFALFGFWTLILFGTFCGIPQGAPVPAWLPAASSVASALTIVPLIAIAIIFGKTVCGANVQCKGGPFCYIKFGTVAFLLSALMMISLGCPHFSKIVEFTWFGAAQIQLQIFGFFAIVICGAIYELLPGVMNFELPFPKFVRLQHWLFMLGVAILVLSLAIGGIEQGLKNFDFQTVLPFLRVSTLGLLFLLLGSLLFAANIFAMTFKWKCALLKSCIAAIKAPLETTSASLRRDKEVKS
jgi:cytochrome c oxidase cbb3-type subunit 1